MKVININSTVIIKICHLESKHNIKNDVPLD